MNETTDHPGEGWEKRPGLIKYARAIGGADAQIWRSNDTWYGYVAFTTVGDEEKRYITPAPTAALAAQRVAALADQVREDVRRLAEAWGVAPLPNPSEIPNSSPPTPTVDRKAAIDAIHAAIRSALDADDAFDSAVPGADAVLDAILATITPRPEPKEAKK